MPGFFTSGAATIIVLAVLALEALWLTARWRRPAAVLVTLGPGALMVIAVHAALTGASWLWVAAPLALSLPVHLMDLRQRPLHRR